MALSLDQIRRVADRVAASHRLDVVEIEYLGGGKNRVLRVFIEQNREERGIRAQEAKAIASKGVDAVENEGAPPAQVSSQAIALEHLAWITHEDCERFSRDFGAVLDVEDLAPGSQYTLEISSPGLDRSLTKRDDYDRFQQSLVKVKTFAPVADNRHWQGRLTEVKAGGIVLDLTATRQRGAKKMAAAEQRVEISFANIEKANLVPEF